MAKYKNAKQLKKSTRKEISDSNLHRYLIAIPLFALLTKFVIMANIQSGAWFGADGENYTKGIDGLLKDGFFSEEPKLSYWPAGYPLLLWPIAIITTAKFYYILSFIQSVFFAFSTYFFTNKLRTSSLRFLALWTSIIVTLNPTLSLSSLSVGYETPISACFMMIAGTILSTLNKPIDRKFWIAVVSVGGWFALSTLMQPRFLLIAVIVAILWALKVAGTKNRIRIGALVISIMMIAPAIMVFRNMEAINKATISTNLGVTMRIGAGPETSGGYGRTGPEVPCVPKAQSTTVSDNEIVICVLKWYVNNPIDAARLSISKTLLFWSPWSGPLSFNGTMGRNPWLLISPIQEASTQSALGQKIVLGPIGTFISYIWLFGQIGLLFAGYQYLRKRDTHEKFFAQIVLTPVILSWLISIGTIGDHRFRVPTMSLSLFLQVVGILAVRNQIKRKIP